MENGRKGEIVGRRVSFPGGDELQCEVAEAKVRGVERSVGRVGGWQMQPADAQEQLHRKLLSCCSRVGQRGSPASLGKSQKINSNGKELKGKTEQTNVTKGRL